MIAQCELWTRALSGHNSTVETRSELLFLWWHCCCYWLTQVCLWKSLKTVVWVNCSLTKKKITRLVYYLANPCGEDNVGSFVKYTKGVGLLSPFRDFFGFKTGILPYTSEIQLTGVAA